MQLASTGQSGPSVPITFYLALRECRLLVADICMISSGEWKVLLHLEVLISLPMDELGGGWLELAGPGGINLRHCLLQGFVFSS
jgi:hypothetical protein